MKLFTVPQGKIDNGNATNFLAPPFTNSFKLISNACQNTNPACIRNTRRLPCAWIDILVNRYNNASERNAWADFNPTARAHEEFQDSIRPFGYSILCEDDAPSFPDTDDFTDLEKSRDTKRNS